MAMAMTSQLLAAAEPASPSPGAAQPAPLAGPFRWKSSGALIKPVSDDTHKLVSVKDPTVVYYGDKWHVYATTANARGSWSMVYLSFKDWPEAAKARPYYMDANPPHELSVVRDLPILGYFGAKQVLEQISPLPQ